MGLWLKCPGCQVQNPLSLRVCPHCGQDLVKLLASQRVYVIGAGAAPPPAKPKPAASSASPPSPPASAAPKPPKKPTRAKKKKS